MKILTTVNYNGSNIISDYQEEKSSQTVIYNGSTIATISPGASGTLLTSGKQCNSNIAIGGKTLVTNGKLLNSNIGISVVKYSRLPTGYTETEYTQATGTQWTDLGFADTSGIIVNYKCSWQSSGYVIGSHNAGEPYGRNSGYLDYNRGFWELGYGDYCPQTTTAPRALNTIYDVEFSTVVGNGYLKVNGTTYITITSSTTISGLNVLLFSNQYPYGYPVSGVSAKLYSAQIKNHSGTLIRNLVSCTNSSNVPGFYDLLNNKFYYSDTSTAYIAGPEV